MFSETDFIGMLTRRFGPGPEGRAVLLAIGDDGAVLATDAGEMVVTTDMVLEGVDFRIAECGYRAAGQKALGRALSDLAAMGVEPWCAVTSIALPRGFAADDADQLLDGLFHWSSQFDCPIIGGDSKRSGAGLVIDVTALGRASAGAPVRRTGARPGDQLYVTGALGGSILGRHLDFTPRVAEGMMLNRRLAPGAMIDLSDGLSVDLARLCTASGVGARVDAEAVPISAAAARLADRDGGTPLEHALHDGEDYELLVALDERAAALVRDSAQLSGMLTRIGRIVAPEEGLLLVRSDLEEPLRPLGFEHRFADGAVSPGDGEPS